MAVLAGLAGLSCAAPPAYAPAAENQKPASLVRVANRPPLGKDVIDAVLASAAVPLTVSPSCDKAGTEPADATIGRYLAGFMAEMSSASAGNAIQTSVEPGQSATGERVWVCRLTLRHADGDEVWGWGVQFHVRDSDGAVLADSFTCTGAG
jgi:hypothetical protein